MTLKETLDAKRYAYTEDASGITVTHSGDVYLGSLTTLPEGVRFETGGHVYLGSLTTLPEGVRFENGGYVYLGSLTTLPEGVRFENGGYVYLGSLTTLPEGVRFENGGYVDLPSLTTLPEGVRFENGGGVYLPSLDHRSEMYRGKQHAFRHIDGSTMILTSSREVGGITIMRARYMSGGSVEKMKRCYIAQVGEFYAHGDTRERAIADARFKSMQSTMDTSEVESAVREAGHFTRETFRLLTGACGSGVEHFLEQAGLAGKDTLPISETVRLTQGQYGGETISRLFSDYAEVTA